MPKLTPLMQQYWEIKALHKDKIVMFRLGDFFEMFHEDAQTAAPILNIVLTSRNKKSEDHVPMCGIPYHSVAIPISKLLAEGYKVALCDQVEDPKAAKGLVKRAVTRVLSPGMVYDPDTLDPLQAHYICSFDENFVAFLDISTGEAFYYSLNEGSQPRQVLSFVSLLLPAEIVLTSQQKMDMERENRKKIKDFYLNIFEWKQEEEAIKRVNDFASKRGWSTDIPAVRFLVAYVLFSQGEEALKHLMNFEKKSLDKQMMLSERVCAHLEIFKTSGGKKKGSLFSTIQYTKTALGARLLKSWLCFPFIRQSAIEKRLDEVEHWVQNMGRLKRLRLEMGKLSDLERRIGKLSHPGCNARDVRAFAASLRAGLFVSSFCLEEGDVFSPSPFSQEFLRKGDGKQSLLLAEEVLENIESTLLEEPSSNVKEGGMIRAGFHSELDQWMALSEDTQKLLLDIEIREKKSTQIPSLKIRYNHVFGYFIEVTHKYKDQVPRHYVRRQTLTHAERFVTEDLKKLEEKILSAHAKKSELEFQIFEKLRKKLVSFIPEFKMISHFLGEIDVLSSFAWLAIEQNYVRPSLSEEESLIELMDHRHPVLEREINLDFVSNNVKLKPGECLLLTGPNMAGKSTLMRQVALTAILAQIGSFVPARRACLPIFQQIFTRVGAHDNLSEGLSTFMVEMKETVEILNKAHSKSLVILDEIGRGTSTYDGMSLAQAILEFLVVKSQSYVFFATHYHELTLLSKKFSNIHNYYMKILENPAQNLEKSKAGKQQEEGERIQFLYHLTPGSMKKSYGVQVAELAGFPSSVIHRAKDLLAFHERQKSLL